METVVVLECCSVQWTLVDLLRARGVPAAEEVSLSSSFVKLAKVKQNTSFC